MATTTFYPDPNPETTSVDGRAYYYDPAGGTWATAYGHTGTGGQSANAHLKPFGVYADTNTNTYDEIDRGIFLYDTSAITDTDTIDSATLSIMPTTTSPITDQLGGSHSVALVSSAPASNTAIVGGDFNSLGSTRFATDITLASMAADTYFDFTLNASGLAAITTTGVSKFGVRIDIDLDNSEPTWASDEEISVSCYLSNNTGTASDPKLVVVHSSTVNSHSLDLESTGSQYASITDASQTGLDITGDMTIECWFKPESDLNSTHELVAKWLEASNRSYRFYYDDSANALKFNVSSDGITAESLTVSQTLTVGTWYHVAVAWDASASSAEFFVNGLSIGSNAGAVTAAHSGTGAVAIGCRDVGGTPKGFVDGLIEEVRVWDDIRTDQEIVDNAYTKLVGNEANLQGYWQLNNDYLDETSNGNDLTASGSPVFSTVVPWTSTNTKSLDLESTSNQYASNTVTSGLTITGDMTIEFWCKPESLATDMFMVESGTSGDGDSNGNALFEIRFVSDGSLVWKHEYSAGTDEEKTTVSSGYVTTGVWQHFAFVRDTTANDILFYKDGILLETVAYTNEASGGSTGNKVFIGTNSNLTTIEDYDGLIDEIRIWDTIRTADQIAAAMDVAIKSDHANLQACYALDDDYLDETGNNNDLTATNAPVFSTDVPTWPYVAPAAASTISHNMYIIL